MGAPQLRGAVAPASERNLTGKQNAAKALELRKAGLSYAAIAREMGYADESGAHHAVRRAIETIIPKDVAEEVRQMELERLDQLWQPMYRKALQGDRLAVDRCLSIMERRSAYLGLDAPIRIQQLIVTEEQFAEAIEQLEKQAAALEMPGYADDDVIEAEVVED